jgi:predicted DNA-binding protein (UPF0251 family)
LFPAVEARQLQDDPRAAVQQSTHDDKFKDEEAESEIAKVNHAHATELERVQLAHQAKLERLRAAHKAELEREKKTCLERAEVARKQAADNLAQAKGIYDGQVKASEERYAAELKSSEEKYAAKDAKMVQNGGVLYNSGSKKYKRLYLAKLAELNKLKDGYEKLKAGYDKDYNSREAIVNACLRENQKRDVEVEKLKKDNETKVKELKVKLEEALAQSVHDMYPDMVREYIKLLRKLA